MTLQYSIFGKAHFGMSTAQWEFASEIRCSRRLFPMFTKRNWERMEKLDPKPLAKDVDEFR